MASSKQRDPRTIQLDPQSHGDLVKEVVRAYLHTGNVSCLLKRVVEGMHAFKYEAEWELNAREERLIVVDAMHGVARVVDTAARAEDALEATWVRPPASEDASDTARDLADEGEDK